MTCYHIGRQNNLEMKNLIIFLAIIVCGFGSCKELTTQSLNKFEGISWETERLSEYQLIRPLNFNEGATDAYNLPIRPERWYLISRSTDCYLLPVETSSGGQNFVENIIRYNKIAIVDTMFSGYMSGSKKFSGLNKIHTMEIICFTDGYSVRPRRTQAGELTVGAEQKP